jgi:GAF domain-containing protein
MANDTSADIAAAFAEITRAIADADDLDATLARISQFAVIAVDGCVHAGVTVREPDRLVTRAPTAPVVEEIDRMQYTLGEGPCVTAAEERAEQYAPDLATDPRWPRFGPYTAEMGLASLLSVPLYLPDDHQTALGALNLYGSEREAFSERDRSVAVVLAAHASIALSTMRSASHLRRENADLMDALASRDVIGQAKGILMERYKLSADEAFDMLRKASQHLNVKLRTIAEDVSDTGVFPPERRSGAGG